MTIICVKNGVMAADTAIYDGDLRVGSQRKIFRSRHGWLAAFAGKCSLDACFNAWLDHGDINKPLEIDEEESGFGGLVLLPSGVLHRVDNEGSVFPSAGRFAAEGYCRIFAFGCLCAGASAEAAVSLCIAHHDGCGGDVQVERLNAFPVEEQRIIWTNPVTGDSIALPLSQKPTNPVFVMQQPHDPKDYPAL